MYSKSLGSFTFSPLSPIATTIVTIAGAIVSITILGLVGDTFLVSKDCMNEWYLHRQNSGRIVVLIFSAES
jgi:hypothetical protein